MAIVHVISTSAVGTPDSVTTSSVDTSGANFLVMCVAQDGTSSASISDSKGNTWTALTSTTQGATKATLYYAANATTGTGHTFTNGGSQNYSSICVSAFSGVKSSLPSDQEAGSGATATTLSPGSVTPTESNELVISGIGFSGAGLPATPDGGFTLAADEEFGSGNNYGSAIAYLIQTSATAANPQWTRTNSNPIAGRNATFKSAQTSAGFIALL